MSIDTPAPSSGRTLTYFVSDLHIGASYIADTHEHQRSLCRWLLSIEPQARQLYLLGDILDYWYEYRTVSPRGYLRFLGTLAWMADRGVKITWLRGNHDIWLFDYLSQEIGLTVADGILDVNIDGKRFVLEHGDGVGEPRPTYRMIRRLFRNRIAQRLYAAIHPRWTIAFAHTWSRHSRLHSTESNTILNDTDPAVTWAHRYENANGHVDWFVIGHRHIHAEKKISTHSKLVVIGDGFKLMTYAVFDGTTLHVRRMENISSPQLST